MIRTLASAAAVILLAGVALAEMDAGERAIAERQVATLRELAAEGAIDAYYQLGVMAQADTEFELFTPDEALQFLATAARAGNAEAIRALAFALLEGGDETLHDEVATLIAVSALLGLDEAIVDLKLMPKFTPIQDDQIVAGFNTALERLSSSRSVDCERLGAALCPSWTDQMARLHPRYVFFARALAEAGPYATMVGIEQVFADQLAAYSAFSSRKRARMEEESNRLLEEKMAQRAREAQRRERERLSASELRERKIDETVRRFLAIEASDDFALHRERIVKALEGINAYRDVEDHVDIQTLESRLPGDQP